MLGEECVILLFQKECAGLRVKTVLLESGECMVRQGRFFRGVFLLAGVRLARRLVRKRNLDEP